MENQIKLLNKDPFNFIQNISIKQLEDIIKYSADKYYNTDKSVISDNTYDLLIEYLQFKQPKNKLLKTIGASVKLNKNKVKLKYHLGSMDKIKPDSNKLDNFMKKYESPYVLSDKLDGVSALLIYNDNKITLFTRGTATEGLDISKIVKYLNLPDYDFIIKKLKKQGNTTQLALRGELIIKDKVFNEKYSSKLKNARNSVAGLVNSKKINPELAKDTDLVLYEVIDPNMKILDQFKLIEKLGFNCVNYKTTNTLSYEYLSEYLKERRNNGKYIIDGIIVTNNKKHKRNTDGNPKYAFAFKDILEDQKAITNVIDIEWKVSKDKLIKPTIIVEPVNIGGVTISRVSGHNAKYICDNKIGKNSKLQIIRSGDVIPKVDKVLKESKPLLPELNYKWNKTKVEIYIDEDVDDVFIKNIYYFFNKLGSKGLGEKIVEKIYKSGFISVKEFLELEKDDLLEIDGFKDKLADKILKEIKNSVKDIEEYRLWAASNKFGTGLGEKKLKLIYEKLGNSVLNNNKDEVYDNIIDIEGFEDKTTKLFIKTRKEYNKFYNEIKDYVKFKKIEKIKLLSNKFNDMIFVFSGFRDKELEKYITDNGGLVKNTISKKTTYLIVKELSSSSKITKATKLGINIILKDKFNL